MALNEYPRPHLRRDDRSFQILNGKWDYKIINGKLTGKDDLERLLSEIRVPDGQIEVPYSPEAELSGVDRMLRSGETLILRRTFGREVSQNDRYFLRFGAVDQRCRVWLNGTECGYHEDGYIPFDFDVTESIRDKDNELIVSVIDDSDSSDLPYGKQKVNRGQIWYPPQSGIWQTVWLESVPEDHVEDINVTYSPDGKLRFELKSTGNCESMITIFAPTLKGTEDPEFLMGEHDVLVEIENSDSIEIPYESGKLWSPDEPWLYPVNITYGKDSFMTYAGLRYVSIEKDSNGIRKIFVNGKPLFQSGVLDQGYYDKGLYTQTSDQQIVTDLKMLKEMGFNMVRKHIKVEPLRWYYHCDRLGLIVWQDMVSGGNDYKPMIIQYLPFIGFHLKDKRYGLFGREDEVSRRNAEIHQKNVIDTLKFFPSIIMWVISNEGWGQFDSVRLAVEAKMQDPTRLVDHASGWHDQGGPDFKSPHVYYKKIRLKPDDRALILSEFGGYSYPVKGHSPEKAFGYRVFGDQRSYNEAVRKLFEDEIMPYRDILSGIVYTQLSDVEDEVNGLVTYDREVIKWDSKDLAHINRMLIKGK